MRLGIDFGTTRTIVSTVDRGNYPIVSFLDPSGDTHDHFPSVVARRGDRLVHGFEALAPGGPVVRSFKRFLAEAGAHPELPVLVGGAPVALLDLLTGYLAALRTAIVEASNLTGTKHGCDDGGCPGVFVPGHLLEEPPHQWRGQLRVHLVCDDVRRDERDVALLAAEDELLHERAVVVDASE